MCLIVKNNFMEKRGRFTGKGEAEVKACVSFSRAESIILDLLTLSLKYTQRNRNSHNIPSKKQGIELQNRCLVF